ncbi:MAG: hypothetical protein ABSA41_15365 [Terriglobia bacterium]|jgi:hypothetical protein
MTLTRSFKLAMAVGVGLLAACFTANLAKASDAYTGKFTLPFEARWGGLVLPAGEYSFTLNDVTAAGMIAVRRDRQNLGVVLVRSISDYGTSGKSELVAVSNGGVYRISTLRLETGERNDYVIGFLTPKAEQPAPARGPEVSWRVPISGSGR